MDGLIGHAWKWCHPTRTWKTRDEMRSGEDECGEKRTWNEGDDEKKDDDGGEWEVTDECDGWWLNAVRHADSDRCNASRYARGR